MHLIDEFFVHDAIDGNKKLHQLEMDNVTVLLYIPQYEYSFVSSYWPKLRMNQQLGVCAMI